MRVTNLKLPRLVKLSTTKPGDLVTVYGAMLQTVGTYIVAASTQMRSIVNSDGVSVPSVPQAPSGPGGWGQEAQVLLFAPEDGFLHSASPHLRCHVHKGAAVVLDFTEGA